MKFIAHDYNITLPHAAHTEVRFLTTKCQLSSVQFNRDSLSLKSANCDTCRRVTFCM